MRRVLLVAFHFPPLVGSSGIQRTLRFAQHLPEFGWQPTVLTVTPRAYEACDLSTIAQIPSGCDVVRVPCLDTGRHLALAGRYPRIFANPDRWMSWKWFGTRTGVNVCTSRGIDAIWSTYPIATAHKLASSIAQATKLPWIADFRDPMAQIGYPVDPRVWQAFRDIETNVAQHASAMVFVTESARQAYRQLFPSVGEESFRLIENGFDESSFDSLRYLNRPSPTSRPITLLHSGIVYRSERDPSALMQALAQLQGKGIATPNDLRIRFRASSDDALLVGLASKHGVSEFIETVPPIPYQEALLEMVMADGLLLLQGENCNEQIPAKMYEYFRARRPILGLADPAGDTGKRLIGLGFPHVAKLESVDAIATALTRFVSSLREGNEYVLPDAVISRFSRRNSSRELALLLDRTTEDQKQSI